MNRFRRIVAALLGGAGLLLVAAFPALTFMDPAVWDAVFPKHHPALSGFINGVTVAIVLFVAAHLIALAISFRFASGLRVATLTAAAWLLGVKPFLELIAQHDGIILNFTGNIVLLVILWSMSRRPSTGVASNTSELTSGGGADAPPEGSST